MTQTDKPIDLFDWLGLEGKISQVQWLILSNMRNTGLPVAVRCGPDRPDYEFVNRHSGTANQWLWAGQSTVTAMKRHGWIEWHAGSAEKRAGYYVTAAGREVLLT
jgi:hypothetical protein